MTKDHVHLVRGRATRQAKAMQPCSLALGNFAGSAAAFRQELNHLAVEGWNIAGLPAAYPVGIANDLAVFPNASCVADVVLDGVVAGQAASTHQAGGDQQPRSMADDRDGFAFLVNGANQLLRLFVYPQSIGVERASGKQHSV